MPPRSTSTKLFSEMIITGNGMSKPYAHTAAKSLRLKPYKFIQLWNKEYHFGNHREFSNNYSWF